MVTSPSREILAGPLVAASNQQGAMMGPPNDPGADRPVRGPTAQGPTIAPPKIGAGMREYRRTCGFHILPHVPPRHRYFGYLMCEISGGARLS